jgi:hypothetical protein
VDAQDDLGQWVASVRERLARGELADLGAMPVLEDYQPLPGELFVRIMLADYDHYDDLPPARRREPAIVAQRLALLEDLRRLCELIG